MGFTVMPTLDWLLIEVAFPPPAYTVSRAMPVAQR
jgi:hypothetical protein